MADILVVGSFVMDQVATMNQFPEEGHTVLGTSIAFYPGGKGINQCVSIARLGGNVEMAGMLGDDENGEIFKKILNDEGITCHNVFTCEEPTAVAQIQINKIGQNRICVIPSANYEFSTKEIEIIKDSIKDCKLLVLQLELKLEIIEQLIKLAKSYKVKVLLNPAPAFELKKDILALVDYLTPNEYELSILAKESINSEKDVINASKKLLELGVKNIITTIGKRGAIAVNNSQTIKVGGYEVKAVDTVAAGDSFNGALALKIVQGYSLEESITFANAMGALTVTKKGAIPSLHTLKEVERFLLEKN